MDVRDTRNSVLNHTQSSHAVRAQLINREMVVDAKDNTNDLKFKDQSRTTRAAGRVPVGDRADCARVTSI